MPNYLYPHLKLHHLHFTQINELYVSLSLQAFSLGLIGIFVPIYIYNLGFSIQNLALFFIVTALTRTLMHPLVAKLVMKYGPKHIITVSYILLFCYMISLYLLPTQPQLLFFAAILGGIADDMFWMARHIDLATVTTNKNTAKKFSILLIFSTFAQALSPLIGGFIASSFGMGYTILGASIGLIIAMYPLIKTPEPVVPRKINLRIFRTAPVKHMIANFAINAQGVIAAFQWPLFIFLIVQTYREVGIVSSASLLIVVITLIFLGRVKIHNDNNRLLKIGSNLRSGVHITRTLSQSFSSSLGINALGDITDTLITVPYALRFYTGARKYGISGYLTDMEIAASLGHIFVWALLLITSAVFELKTALIISFVVASLLMPLLRLIESVPPVEANKN